VKCATKGCFRDVIEGVCGRCQKEMNILRAVKEQNEINALRSRVEALESMVRSLIREGNCLIASATHGESAQETAALDWCDTVDEAAKLLAPPANEATGTATAGKESV